MKDKIVDTIENLINSWEEKNYPPEVISMIVNFLTEDYWVRLSNLKKELNVFYNFIWDLEEGPLSAKENNERKKNIKLEGVLEKICSLKEKPQLMNDFIVDNIFYNDDEVYKLDNVLLHYINIRLKNEEKILEESYDLKSRFLVLTNFKMRFKNERDKLINSIFDDAKIYSLFRFIHDKSNLLSLDGREVSEILSNEDLLKMENLIDFIKSKQKELSFKDNNIETCALNLLEEIGANKLPEKAKKIMGDINEEIHEENLYILERERKIININEDYIFHNYLDYDIIFKKLIF